LDGIEKRVSRLPATIIGMLKKSYPSPSRREFLTTAVGAGGAMLLGPAWMKAAADEVGPRDA